MSENQTGLNSNFIKIESGTFTASAGTAATWSDKSVNYNTTFKEKPFLCVMPYGKGSNPNQYATLFSVVAETKTGFTIGRYNGTTAQSYIYYAIGFV